MGFQIIPFEGNVSKYIDELVQLDELCLAAYGAAWTKENFMMHLPHKGQLSKLAVSNGKLMAYAICSAYNRVGHIHRLAVSPAFQRRQVGTKLMKELARECLALGIRQITVESPLENVTANNYYKKIGFHRLKSLQLRDYLVRKGKQENMAHYIGRSKSRAVYIATVEGVVYYLRIFGESMEIG